MLRERSVLGRDGGGGALAHAVATRSKHDVANSRARSKVIARIVAGLSAARTLGSAVDAGDHELGKITCFVG
jgi:hypothetical protein